MIHFMSVTKYQQKPAPQLTIRPCVWTIATCRQVAMLVQMASGKPNGWQIQVCDRQIYQIDDAY